MWFWFLAFAAAAAAGVAVSIPRGIRNNNPGNLRDAGIPWRGLEGRDADGYAKFRSALEGIRAMYIDLRTGFERDREDTVREIIAEWAPSHENPTERYMQFVARELGVDVDEPLELERHRVPLIEAIIRFENGEQPYSRGYIMQAIRAA